MNRRRIAAIVCVLALLGAAGAARHSARQTRLRAQALLLWSDAAQDRIPHTGRLVTSTYAGNRPVTSEVSILRVGPQRSRVEYLTPPMRGTVVIEDGGLTLRYDPLQNVLHAERPRSLDETQRRRYLAQLMRNYPPRFLRRAFVAGRPAVGLELAHRLTGRVARRLWVDEATGLVLRSQDYRLDGQVVTATTYQEVRYGGPIPMPLAMPSPTRLRVVHHEAPPVAEADLTRAFGAAILRPRYLPEVFAYEGSFRGRCSCCGDPMAQMLYSDGLRSISVFQCAHGLPPGQFGEVVSLPQGGMARVQHRGRTFILVGDATAGELRRMSQSLP